MRNEILKQAVKLRASTDDIASKIYISADLTPTQRQEVKQLVSEKERRQQEEGQTDFIWIIRGGTTEESKENEESKSSTLSINRTVRPYQ